MTNPKIKIIPSKSNKYSVVISWLNQRYLTRYPTADKGYITAIIFIDNINIVNIGNFFCNSFYSWFPPFLQNINLIIF